VTLRPDMRVGSAACRLLVAVSCACAAGAGAPVVDDVSQLNPIRVERVVAPSSVEDVQALVREHHGPISIGGARHSMGGQIASEGALFLDMRSLDRVIELAVEQRWIRVEAGITWRKIQEAIDPQGLSMKSMQSFANFTVGGSLSVNAHGRYVGQGPLIESVRSIRVVLADGSLVEASRDTNRGLFFGCIGGYGGLGVIVEATLDLAENRRIARDVRRLPVAEYRGFFFEQVRSDGSAVFHNGDLYPPDYDSVRAITWRVTERPVTVPERLVPVGGAHWVERVAMFGVSELPLGKELRADVVDPLRLRGHPVVWRNYEASLDVAALEPSSRKLTTYVLQEYFVPVRRFDDFVPRMAEIFRRHRVNVINVSVRHTLRDPGTLLAWAKQECFSFVVYYKQRTSESARAEVGVWTRELIDAALALDGSYYLPYQIHATFEQFQRAYPRAPEFFALKRRLDPDQRFRNQLWDRYYPSLTGRGSALRDAPDGDHALRLERTGHPVERGRELGQEVVAAEVGEAPAVLAHQRRHLLPKGRERADGALFVCPDQPAVAGDVGGEDRRQSPLGPGRAHGWGASRRPRGHASGSSWRRRGAPLRASGGLEGAPLRDEDPRELVLVDRLRQMSVEPGLAGPAAIHGSSVPGDRNQQVGIPSPCGSHCPSDRTAVEVRKADVHQDDVGA